MNSIDDRVQLACNIIKTTIKDLDLLIGIEKNTNNIVFVDKENYLLGKRSDIRMVNLKELND